MNVSFFEHIFLLKTQLLTLLFTGRYLLAHCDICNPHALRVLAWIFKRSVRLPDVNITNVVLLCNTVLLNR